MKNVGRPRFGQDLMHKRSVMMDDALVKKAQNIGGGNLSKGIRLAVTDYEEKTMKTKWLRYGCGGSWADGPCSDLGKQLACKSNKWDLPGSRLPNLGFRVLTNATNVAIDSHNPQIPGK